MTQRKRPWKEYGEKLTFDDIQRKIIPGVRKFVDRVARANNLEKVPGLSDDDIREHYHKAAILRRLMMERFGRNLGDIPVSIIKGMEVGVFQEMVGQMDRIYQMMHPVVPGTRQIGA